MSTCTLGLQQPPPLDPTPTFPNIHTGTQWMETSKQNVIKVTHVPGQHQKTQKRSSIMAGLAYLAVTSVIPSMSDDKIRSLCPSNSVT